MSTHEKTQLRDQLLSFMEYHPIPESQSVDLRQLLHEGKEKLDFWTAWTTGRVAGTFVVLLLVTVPALAENSLPGEALYPVKVRFNEEIKGALNSSPYQKIEWETERLERRITEVELLADSGRLTPEVEATLASAIVKHSLTAKSSIDAIRINDNDEAVMAEIALSSALDVSAEMLEKREGKSGMSTTSESVLAGAVSEARANVSSENVGPSYIKLLSRVETETTRAYEYLDSLKDSISDKERKDITRRLDDVKFKVESAVKIEAENQPEAVKLLSEALGSTNKLMSFMTNLGVRQTVTIEELVPVVPNEEEKRENLTEELEEALTVAATVKVDLPKISTSSNDYKAVSDSLTQLDVLVIEAEAALEVGDLEGAETMITEVAELAKALKSTMDALKFKLDMEVEGSVLKPI